MINYEAFKERFYPNKKQYGYYSDEILNKMRNDLPDAIVEFLQTEGICSYANNFMWTASPYDYHQALSAWGLKGIKCFTFFRSAFGACIYFHKNEYFYLDPIEGRILSLDDDAYMLLNYSLTMDIILNNGFFKDYFDNIKADTQLLNVDLSFSFNPAIPLGGSFETSKIEVVKTYEHLIFLAQLFGGKAKRIR